MTLSLTNITDLENYCLISLSSQMGSFFRYPKKSIPNLGVLLNESKLDLI
jgi:hypothetical protein